MKKPIILLYVILFLLAPVGCSKVNQSAIETQSDLLVGYIVVTNNTLNFDEVEIVKSEDKNRMSELGLSDTDMPNGYAIINQNKEEKTFELTDETVYTFTDLDLYFVTDADGNRIYTTTKKDEFVKHLGELNASPLSEQKIPYFVEVRDGKVILITEKFEFTI